MWIITTLKAVNEKNFLKISQFSYCPLVWMFHSRGKNNKTNQIHERCLGMIFNDKISTFYELLKNGDSVSIYKQNLRFLVCEMFKLKRDIVPELIEELILQNRQRSYELRNNLDFAVPIVKSVQKGLESLRHLRPKIWELLRLEIKETETFSQFKAKTKKWNLQIFRCCICKIYLQNVGFNQVNKQRKHLSFLSWISLSNKS